MGPKQLVEIKSIVNRFAEALRGKGIHPETILLYGSFATGNATPDSDIDLVVISEDWDSIPPLERLRVLAHAAWPLQAGIEAMGYTPQEIAERGHESILWEAVQKHHQVIYRAA